MPLWPNTLLLRCLGRWGILLDTARDSAARIHHIPIFMRTTLALRSHHRKPPILPLYSDVYNSSRSLYPHIQESYPSEDEDEGLEYMKGTEHPPNEYDRSGIDDVLELAPGDSPLESKSLLQIPTGSHPC
ncbi:hypothetical protein B0H13DRAFT_1930566 [Mycena leptocephala]|nr:hypothetical protein B0H13DRAFT_1930566 [Mycena leptocephala]